MAWVRCCGTCLLYCNVQVWSTETVDGNGEDQASSCRPMVWDSGVAWPTRKEGLNCWLQQQYTVICWIDMQFNLQGGCGGHVLPPLPSAPGQWWRTNVAWSKGLNLAFGGNSWAVGPIELARTVGQLPAGFAGLFSFQCCNFNPLQSFLLPVFSVVFSWVYLVISWRVYTNCGVFGVCECFWDWIGKKAKISLRKNY